MYFTDREKKILQLLVQYRDGISPDELSQQLHVSKRTIYREMATIESGLTHFQLQIIKPRGNGYRLVGESFQIVALDEYLKQTPKQNFDMVMRQRALVVVLLQASEPQTMESLALDFQVSVGTIISDLQAIEDSLAAYRLQLIRKKTVGIIVEGDEIARRQILTNVMHAGTNEYDFFQYLKTVTADSMPVSDNFFVKQLPVPAWYAAKTIVMDQLDDWFAEISDHQLKQLIIGMVIALSRMTQQHDLKTNETKRLNTSVQPLVKRLVNQMEQVINQPLNAFEENYIAAQLEGLNYKLPQHIFNESFDVELSYRVKEFIRDTSFQAKHDFRYDDILFDDLLAHISAALKRPLSLMQQLNNPLLNTIIEEYDVLYRAVEQAFRSHFPNREVSQDELAYIVIHFATSLERNPRKSNISMLVLCASGVGTAKILESRIRKYLPEVKTIDIARVSQLDKFQLEQYSMILSTIMLPGFNRPYRVITPLLLDDEIQDIRQYMRQLYDFELEDARKPAEQSSVKDVDSFDEIYQTMRIANTILQQFDLMNVASNETLEETLYQILQSLEPTIVSDAKKVTDFVVQRYLVAPIGIPNTNIALLHSSNAWVTQPFFAIYQLDRSFSILGMDKKSIDLDRILLMLAPDPLSHAEQYLLGKISSSIIENDLNTEIYKNGSKEIMYQLISSLFVEELRILK